MNTSFPPHTPQGAPRKLERSTSNRMIGGVCAGVADYLNLDPTLVRILTALIALVTGVPVVLYIVAMFVMPEASEQPAAPAPSPGPGFPPPAPAAPPVPDTGGEPDIWGTERAPWEQSDAATSSGPTIDPVYPEPTDAEPIAPSEPEAPVVTPNEDSDGSPNKPGPYSN